MNFFVKKFDGSQSLRGIVLKSRDCWAQLEPGGVNFFRVVSRFLSSRFHPKSRRLFLFYLSNITLRTDLLTFRVTGAVFKIAGEMRCLQAYFDNPVILVYTSKGMSSECIAFKVALYTNFFCSAIEVPMK